MLLEEGNRVRRGAIVVLGLLSAMLIVCNRTPPGESPVSESTPSSELSAIAAPTAAAERPLPPGGAILPDDFTYLGAFRLPDDGDRPRTFEYGGSAMTFRPDGDPEGEADGFSGSLFIAGHDRLPYGELPDGNQVAEVTIPAPVIAGDPAALPQAEFLQPFTDVAGGAFVGLEELPRMAMLYLDHPQSGAAVHLAFGQHFQSDPTQATHGWFSPDLTSPDLQGEWFIDQASLYSVNGYLLEIPPEWSEAVGGMPLATGRFRDGGWSGMGPALYAYLPWQPDGSAPPDGAQLPATALLQYAASDVTPEIERAMDGYQHPDEWEGTAWLTTPDGRSAVLFAGTKSVGDKYWYGFRHPDGPDLPCVEQELIGQFPLCRLADGSPCPETDLAACPGHSDYRGWWSTAWEGQFILYDPADLAMVAAGEMAPWQPQPYASLSLDPVLLHNPAGVEVEMLGEGAQRRYQVGELGYDRLNQLLYVLEWFADGAKPVVHVWRVD